MGQLHEVLPARDERKAIAKKVIAEAINTCTKKPDHFLGRTKVYTPFDEAKANEVESETKHVDTTVRAKLDYVMSQVVPYFDATAQVDATNQKAVADVLVRGAVLLKSVPSTTLLWLETELKGLRDLADAVPTLAPGKAYDAAADLGDNIWRQRDQEVAFRTAKVIQHKVLVAPTAQHPAQIEKWTEDVKVGKMVTQSWFGLMSVHEKSELLGRIDELMVAVKAARQRANSTEVVSTKIGDAIFGFILDSKTSA